MNPRIDPLIARIALSLYTSGKRTERLPRVVEVQPWERAEIVPFPATLAPMARYHAQLASFEGI